MIFLNVAEEFEFVFRAVSTRILLCPREEWQRETLWEWMLEEWTSVSYRILLLHETKSVSTSSPERISLSPFLDLTSGGCRPG